MNNRPLHIRRTITRPATKVDDSYFLVFLCWTLVKSSLGVRWEIGQLNCKLRTKLSDRKMRTRTQAYLVWEGRLLPE